ncbi:hypothetical protein ACRW9N_10855 [Listeria aquatica]|uniref:hypothetical protein n=1 Tax=Listeria TaxID=1637 RepID=UPI0014314C69|nr:hypothetical protein [Listeria valentina]
MPSAQGIYQWFSGELRWVFLIAVIIVVIVCAYKRSLIGFILALVSMIVIGMFVIKPDLILTLAEWASGQVMK